ncbi:hypothetical protein ACFLTJ_04335, partial [Chloroflexota bacterium]
MNKLVVLTLAAVLSVVLVFIGCAQPAPTPAPAPKGVRAITSCSKFDYAWGSSNSRAMEMLEEEYGVEVSFLDLVAMVD